MWEYVLEAPTIAHGSKRGGPGYEFKGTQSLRDASKRGGGGGGGGSPETAKSRQKAREAEMEASDDDALPFFCVD